MKKITVVSRPKQMREGDWIVSVTVKGLMINAFADTIEDLPKAFAYLEAEFRKEGLNVKVV